MATRPTRGVTSALGARQATSTSMPTTVRGPGTPDGSTGSDAEKDVVPDRSSRVVSSRTSRTTPEGSATWTVTSGGRASPAASRVTPIRFVPAGSCGCGGTAGQRRGGSLPLGSVGEPAGERVEGRRGDRDERADVAAQLGGHGGDRIDVGQRAATASSVATSGPG